MKTLTTLIAAVALLLSATAHSGIIYDEDVDGNIAQLATINLGLGLNTIIGDSCWISDGCNEYSWYIALPSNSYLAAASYLWSSPELDTNGAITTFWNGRYALFDGFSDRNVVSTQSWLEGGSGFSVTFDELDFDLAGSLLGENRLLFGFVAARNGLGGTWDFTATFTVREITPTLVSTPSTLVIFGLGLLGLACRRLKKS